MIILVYSIQAYAGEYRCHSTWGEKLRFTDSQMTSEGVNKVFTLSDESIVILKPTVIAHLIKKNREVINIPNLEWAWLGGIEEYDCRIIGINGV